MLKRDSDKQGLQTFTHHQPLLFCPSAVFTYSLNAWRVSVSAYVSCLQRGISVLAIIIQIPPSMHVREQRRDSIERLTMTTDNDVGCLHRSIFPNGRLLQCKGHVSDAVRRSVPAGNDDMHTSTQTSTLLPPRWTSCWYNLPAMTSIQANQSLV